MSIQNTVVQLFANRRAYRACGPTLDAIDAALEVVRARTGRTHEAVATSGLSDTTRHEPVARIEQAMREAAYQTSLKTAATVHQLSLTEFLR